jgi:hypothetical protein
LNGTALLAAVALPVLLGLLGSRLAAALAAPGDGALYRITLYVMGGAVVAHVALTLLDLARVPWSPLLLAALWAVLCGLAYRLLPRGPDRARLPSDFGWGEGVALFALAAFTLVALTAWIAMPDFIYHWGVKAHHYYLARGVDYVYLAKSWNWYTHPDYPNLVPELFALTALLAGGFDEPAMMLVTGVVFALLLAATREGLRRGGADRFTRQAGLVLVALAIAAFGVGHLMAGAADWMLALALAAAVPPLLRPPDRTGDFQIAAAAAFAAAAKLEGIPLAGFLALVQLARRLPTERRPNFAAALRLGLPIAAVVLPWMGRMRYHHLSLAIGSGPFQSSRAGEIFRSVLEAVGTPAWHGFVFAAFLPPLLLLHRRTRPFATAATLQLLFYFYPYFTGRVDDVRFFVLSNFARLTFQLVPACLVAALVVWGGNEKGGDEPRPCETLERPASQRRGVTTLTTLL